MTKQKTYCYPREITEHVSLQRCEKNPISYEVFGNYTFLKNTFVIIVIIIRHCGIIIVIIIGIIISLQVVSIKLRKHGCQDMAEGKSSRRSTLNNIP